MTVLLLSVAACDSPSQSIEISGNGSVASSAGDSITNDILVAAGMDPGFVVNWSDDMSIREFQMWGSILFSAGHSISAATLADLHLPKPPDVPFVRFIDYNEDASELVTCLTDQGFPVTPDPPGSGSPFGADPEYIGDSAFVRAYYACTGMYPNSPASMRPWSRSVYEQYFDDLVANVVPCLEAAGYESAAEIPSFDVWYDEELNSRLDHHWDPWLAAADANDANLVELKQLCPATSF